MDFENRQIYKSNDFLKLIFSHPTKPKHFFFLMKAKCAKILINISCQQVATEHFNCRFNEKSRPSSSIIYLIQFLKELPKRFHFSEFTGSKRHSVSLSLIHIRLKISTENLPENVVLLLLSRWVLWVEVQRTEFMGSKNVGMFFFFLDAVVHLLLPQKKPLN